MLSQLACMCQRSVRFDDWLLMRTYHGGVNDYPPAMLFDAKRDPHELNECAAANPQVVERGLALLYAWHTQMMGGAEQEARVDPLQTVLAEQPYHAGPRDRTRYCAHLRATGRASFADAIEARYGGPTHP